MENQNVYYGTGKRKTAIARVWMKPGTGKITVNKQPADEYFRLVNSGAIIKQPLALTKTLDLFDVTVGVKGGGFSGQAGAIRHGITKVLMAADPKLRPVLKKAGFVTRDSRIKERKKYGQKGARASFQFSKR
jgi:small subunit ribosomal protein S9